MTNSKNQYRIARERTSRRQSASGWHTGLTKSSLSIVLETSFNMRNCNYR